MLQQLNFLGQDGQIHFVKNTNNLFGMQAPLLADDTQMMGAWLDEDGELNTINDLQNLSLDKAEVAQISMGVLSGALKTEDLNDYVTCIQDSEQVVGDIEDAVASFEKQTTTGVITGLGDLADALTVVGAAIGTCSQQKDIAQLKKLEEMLKQFKNPKSFAFHVGKDLLVNGQDIYHQISDAVAQYRAGKYEAFGEDIGSAMALVLIGKYEGPKQQATQKVQKQKKAKKALKQRIHYLLI